MAGSVSRHGGRHRLPMAVLIGMAGFLASGPGHAGTGQLTVQLVGMTSDEGNAAFAMWSGPEGWLGDQAPWSGTVPIENGASSFEFSGLPYGEYAISVFHDRNENRKLDTGLFGIPKEPFGTSNDARASFGPPKYEDARFRLDQPDLTITIVVRKQF